MKKFERKQKKITIFIASLSGGGAERVGCNLANYLSRNGYSVDVITMSNRRDSYVLDVNVERICLLDEKERRGKIYNILMKRKRLKEYVENQAVFCYVAFLPINIFLLTRFRRLIKGKIIISERNNPASYGLIDKLMMKCSIGRCDGLVVQTNEISEWYGDVKNKVIIPNAINEDAISTKRVKVVKKIVAVGRLCKQKNYPMTLEAFSKFSLNHPEYYLEIYGKGSQEKQLKKLVEKYGLAERVRFMGYVDDVSKRIANAACFVMSSDFEGMPNALIEAMCMGLPCVVTDCAGGGARELIVNMENGILVKRGAVDEMVAGMDKIVEDVDFSNMIARNARELRKDLSPDRIYRSWLRFIEEGEDK